MDKPNTTIHSLLAREILDSRANPTIETLVVLQSGYRGVASVPAGASLGKYEAVEIRDRDPKRYGGMGVLKAIGNVNTLIAQKVVGTDAANQSALDKALIDLDGTPNKQVLGANAILSVSLASAAASSVAYRTPLYRYLNILFSEYAKTPIEVVPTPTFNIINGGKHGAGNLDFQEFHVTPATNQKFADALRLGVEVYQATKKILLYRNAVHSVGDEGGFAPDLFTNQDAIEILTEAIRTTPYRLGVDVFLSLDVAASHFKKDKNYQIKDRPAAYTSREFIEYFKSLQQTNRLLLLEDPLGEDDWESWKDLTRALGSDIFIVGDDLLATNLERIQKAIDEKACNAVLLKPNQIGTLSEFFAATALAKKHDMKCVVSNRSGETNDTFLADLAVAVQSQYIKFGAPARGERVAKYNRLLQIEAELGALP
jgi:enolase